MLGKKLLMYPNRRWMSLAKPVADKIKLAESESSTSSTAVNSDRSHSVRNISRLWDRHRIIAERGIPPVSYEWEKEKWAKAERFGQYGLASGVNIAELWPTVEEIEEEEALGIYAPFTRVLEKTKNDEKQREAELAKRLLELENKEKNYGNVLKKFEASKVEAEKELSEKEALLEKKIREIQEYFGYWIDPKDPRFEVMFKQKEAEEKKAAKLAKRQAAQKKTIAAVLDTESASSDAK
ncbi:hypothetical protein AB6A40_004324 [Gnathostoma spinigerum]|uniref:Large ribosomal subunit protein mL64 n=1 Tax=Gnathostoma spinigerum TaxID=75299 RepID=A0ABD6EC62_9BILA